MTNISVSDDDAKTISVNGTVFSTYATINDLLAYIDIKTLPTKDGSNTSFDPSKEKDTSKIDLVKIAYALVSATENINTALKSAPRNYQIQTFEKDFKQRFFQPCVNLAIYFMTVTFSGDTDPILFRYQDTKKMLNDVSKGIIDFGDNPNIDSETTDGAVENNNNPYNMLF